MEELNKQCEAVKKAKATNLYWSNVKTYGGEGNALRALDCINREEAIAMLAKVQTISVFKIDGRVIIQ